MMSILTLLHYESSPLHHGELEDAVAAAAAGDRHALRPPCVAELHKEQKQFADSIAGCKQACCRRSQQPPGAVPARR